MPKLRTLSGEQVIRVFESFGFHVASQKGIHVKLKRIIGESKQILTIPLHKELDKGTLRAIYRQAARYIPEQDLYPHFYEES